ncbi:MAG: PKD domain-containing protein [Bacteroidales bacterium]|nr:PKD domain-containing protein [Bacteroidales bacterium]
MEKINTGFDFILMGIEFPGGQSSIGFAAGESLTYMGDGIVIKTTNGGTTWTQLWTGTDQGIEGISFPDMNTGYVGGWSEYFAKTTDGGLTWTPQTPGTDIYFYTDVVFKDANHGVVTAQTNSGAGVFVTSNGGTTWTSGTGISGVPYGCCYVSGSTYYLVTNGGDIQRSTNDGLTWSTVYSGAGLLLGIDFYNDNIGIAAGEDGWIFKTYDGGATWQPQQIAFGQPLWHDFAWANQNDVFAVGTPEFIYTSNNGGSTWTDDFPQSTYDPALYEVMFTADGIGFICGSQGWFYRRAPQVTAAFTASSTQICQGSTVQFTDQSTGSPTSWNWTFEGGTPSTSTLQNPLVTYSGPGIFDVTLIATKGPVNSTYSQPDLIHVDQPVTEAPSIPSGPSAICGLGTYDYTTTAVNYASSYSWSANPATAGTFSGNGLTATLNSSNTWQGNFNIQVSGQNGCGSGPASPSLAATLYFQPNPYFLFAGGGYCDGDPGYEVRLEDSDPGVSYELFKDGVTTGIILPGTGNSLNFGMQTTGSYSVTGIAGPCQDEMNGTCIVYLIDLPTQASVPTGVTEVCNNNSSTYTSVYPNGAYELIWTLTPSEAGALTPSGTSLTIGWSGAFSGTATLTVAGANECGAGPASPPLSIVVNASPQPVIEGNSLVCQYDNADYEVASNPGSTFTWIVTGGSIYTGQGTNLVRIQWEGTGIGTLSVTEVTEQGCDGGSELFNVIIDPCPGLKESRESAIQLFPNPASDMIYLRSGIGFKELSGISVSAAATGVITEIRTYTIDATTVSVELLSFSSGNYILNCRFNNGTIIHLPFVISK